MCDQPGHLLLKSLAEPAIEPGPRNIGNNYSVLFAADTRGRRFNKGLAAADIQSAPATCSTSSRRSILPCNGTGCTGTAPFLWALPQ